ncbi:GNAT family protein [Actinosynnema mirum]|uniref:GNAT family N-acetyltransferase n=1 Tax=Actinosynnema mirum TaxID=40567 RepID=UPI00019AB6A3
MTGGVAAAGGGGWAFVLRTERLVLRRFSAEDAGALSAYRSDPEVARYQSWEPPVPLSRALLLADEMGEADPGAPGWFQYAVVLDGELVGDIGVHLHEDLRNADIGYTFARAHQGKGYATEAVARVLEDLFTVRGVEEVGAECDSRNVASAKLVARLGFRLVERVEQAEWFKGELIDSLVFRLSAREWRRNGGGQAG